MFQTGPTLFSVKGFFGVRVDVSQSLVILAGLLLFLAGLSNILWVGILVAMLLTSIYLHELGHAWGCLIQGVPVTRIVLHGGGGFCEHARSASRHQQELIVAMGPLVNLALWALASLLSWWIFSSPAMGLDAIGSYLMLFARLNLALFVFNLIPVQPLDGGKLLQLGLLRFLPAKTGDPYGRRRWPCLCCALVARADLCLPDVWLAPALCPADYVALAYGAR